MVIMVAAVFPPRPARAADPNMVIFMDWADLGATPIGWTVVSDSGDTFYNKYVMASNTYESTGGNPTHTHTLAIVDSGATNDSGNNIDKGGTGTTVSEQSHTHAALASSSITPDNNLPNYRSLAVLEYTTGGIPSTLPDNAIVMREDTTLVGNWELYSANDARLVRGSNSTANGGDNNPTHTVASGLGAGGTSRVAGAGGTARATVTHTHAAGSGVASNGPDIIPPYNELVFVRATAAITSLPDQMIAGFSGTAFDSGDWTVVSASSGTAEQTKYYSRFLMGDSSGTLTIDGGGLTHSHANVDISTGTPTGSANYDVAPSNGTAATTGHVHTGVTISLEANVNHVPEYATLVLAQYTQPASLSINSESTLVDLGESNPGVTTADYTFSTSEEIIVDSTDYATWSLTVDATDFISGIKIIADDRFDLATNGNLGTEPTLIAVVGSGTVTEVNNGYANFNSTQSLASLSGGSGSITATVRPTIRVRIPADAELANDYLSLVDFTVV